jgi:hypothetical protein
MDRRSVQCVTCLNRRPDPKPVSSLNRAWLTGLMEGEATLTLKEGAARVRVQMTDEDIIDRVASVTGVGTVRSHVPRSERHKKSWYWTVHTRAHNEWLIELAAPLLGIRRRQAAEALWLACGRQAGSLPGSRSLDPSEAVAWVAGVVEGEGTIYTNPRGETSLSVQSTDQDTVERLLSATQLGRIYQQPSRSERWRPSAVWKVTRVNDLKSLLPALHPWFGTRRQRAAEAALLRLAAQSGR